MLAIMGPALASVLHPLFRPALALAVLEATTAATILPRRYLFCIEFVTASHDEEFDDDLEMRVLADNDGLTGKELAPCRPVSAAPWADWSARRDQQFGHPWRRPRSSAPRHKSARSRGSEACRHLNGRCLAADKLRPGKLKDPTLETGREQQTTFADRRLFIGRSPAGPPGRVLTPLLKMKVSQKFSR